MEFLNLQQPLNIKNIDPLLRTQIEELINFEAIKQFFVPILQILGGIVSIYIIFMIVSTFLNVRRTKRVFLTYGNTERIKDKLEGIEEKIENLEIKIDEILKKQKIKENKNKDV